MDGADGLPNDHSAATYVKLTIQFSPIIVVAILHERIPSVPKVPHPPTRSNAEI
nr:MAG TPA: hypothetical protein [Caudoviricetes sp.]